jgi:phosphoribosylglycinamide formyltransferase 1
MQSKKFFAVMASGEGTNFQALIDKVHLADYPLEISCLVCDKQKAMAMERAKNHNIPVICVPKDKSITKETHEKIILEKLKEYSVDFIVLAGYMRILTSTFLDVYKNKIINTHPSLLPAFKGLDAQVQAYEYGVKYTGCTVHLVTPEMDAGPILGQRIVKIQNSWNLPELKQAILKEEHILLPACVVAFARGNWKIDGRRIIWNKSQ